MAVHELKSSTRQSRPRGLSTLPTEPTRRQQLDHDYWVAHSDGFRVDSAKGRLGFVEATKPDPATPGGILLLVRAGMLGLRVVAVRSTGVAAIVPAAKRISLYSDAAFSTVVKTGIGGVAQKSGRGRPRRGGRRPAREAGCEVGVLEGRLFRNFPRRVRERPDDCL